MADPEKFTTIDPAPARINLSQQQYDDLYDLLLDYCEVLKVSIHDLVESDDPSYETLQMLTEKFAKCNELLRTI